MPAARLDKHVFDRKVNTALLNKTKKKKVSKLKMFLF